jgi:hypothetical protein
MKHAQSRFVAFTLAMVSLVSAAGCGTGASPGPGAGTTDDAGGAGGGGGAGGRPSATGGAGGGGGSVEPRPPQPGADASAGQGGAAPGSGGAGGGGGAGGAVAADAAAPDQGGPPPGPPPPLTIPTSYPTGPGPSSVTQGPDGRLVYVYEPNGDTIPDFSNAGYRGGGVAIPDVAVAVTVMPMDGEADASGRLQAAIAQVAAKPLGPDGYRGAVLIKKGVYPLRKGLVIDTSGVVVRGEGDGEDGTTLKIVDDGGTAVKIFSITDGNKSPTEVPGTRHMLTDPYVPLGARWFRVDGTSGLAVGDTVMVVRPSTTAWIDALGMSAYGWAAGGYDMKFDRVIVAIQGDRVMVDAPVVQSIDAKYGGGYVYKYSYPARLQRVGIERIRGTSSVPHPDGLNVRGNLVDIDGLSDGFFRRLTNWYLQGSPMRINGSKAITVEDMISVHKPWPGPHSGASPSVFTFDGSQLLLFQRLTSSDGGFEFSSGGRNPGPNAYVDSTAPHGYAFSGPHQRWANATLYDHLELAHGLNVRNAKDEGSGHGWQGANHVFWNCKATSFACERPPTAHQWNVGGVAGAHTGDCEWSSFGTPVKPDSLYRAQLRDRLGQQALDSIAARP